MYIPGNDPSQGSDPDHPISMSGEKNSEKFPSSQMGIEPMTFCTLKPDALTQDVTCRSKSIIENVVDKSIVLNIC